MSGREQLLAVVVLVLTTGCVVPLARRRQPRVVGLVWAIATAAALLTWFLHKAPYEGPAIIRLSSTRGLTVVDMIVPPGLALAASVGVRWWVARRRRPGRGSPA